MAVQRLARELVLNGFHDFRLAMSDVEDAETAQAIDVLASVDVAIRVRARVRPFDDRGCAVRIRRFAVEKKTRVEMVAKRLDGFFGYPARFRRVDRGLGD